MAFAARSLENTPCPHQGNSLPFGKITFRKLRIYCILLGKLGVYFNMSSRLTLLSLVCVAIIAAIAGFFLLPDKTSSASASTKAETKTTVANPPPEKREIVFNEHIRPILSNKCYSCHGFDSTTRKENLRLDTQEGAFAALESNPEKFAIVPGDPESSEVWKRITSTDPYSIMPPPDAHKELSEEEIALLTEWIEQGAHYQTHWAFADIEKPELPRTDAENPIDAFVRAKLEKYGLEPAPRAEPQTLLRRLSLDLTGLPPTPAETTAFLEDSSENAYEKAVDRLLASPHYGEKMAISWLDAVRFADTVGYHGDQNINIFPYRDYVIQSFNDNKPFDTFTLEQLAGDLLPNSTEEQKIATGFLRLNLVTREGGAQPGEYLAKSMGDRVRAVGATWLGLTTGCAECHDHKFDPFTAKDFYTMGAFFADIQQWGVYMNYDYTPNPDLDGFTNDHPFPPEIYVKNRAQTERLQNARQDSLQTLKDLPVVTDDFQTWRKVQTDFILHNPTGWKVLEPQNVFSKNGVSGTIKADQSVVFTGAPSEDDLITVTYNIPRNVSAKSFRLEVLPDEANNGNVGRRENGKFTLTPSFAISGEPVPITYAQADRRTPETYVNGFASPLLEQTWESAPARFEYPHYAAQLPQTAIYHMDNLNVSGTDRVLSLTIQSADIGKFRLSVTPFADAVPGEKLALQQQLIDQFSSLSVDNSDLKSLYLLSTLPDSELPDSYLESRKAIQSARAGYAYSLISTPVENEKVLPTHLLTRGDWMSPAEAVFPAFPEFLSKATEPSEKRLNRIDLANWITSSENPLTARHFVNRLWSQFFKSGISGIVDDLGNQGEWPSHPDLINWLAAEFIDSGWNVKHMVKLIVMSDTYQQTAKISADQTSRDPGGKLLSSQAPRRLQAELIRDNALKISGLLADDQIGGPSIFPYQPDNYWENLNFPERPYIASAGPDQYRRTVYTHWQRTFTHPMLSAFDAPSREICTNERFESNSPQQALTLLNDPTFFKAAEKLASKVQQEIPNADVEQKLSRMFQLALARQPTSDEKNSLVTFYHKLEEDTPSADLKTQLARVILNLHETITRY